MRRRRPEAKWTHVASSAVRAVRYHSAQNKLDVRFEEGREYRYGKVPRSKFRALLQTDSIGEFVNHEIKPYHACEEITSFPRRQLEQIPSARRNTS
jgi:hypothetical protein